MQFQDKVSLTMMNKCTCILGLVSAAKVVATSTPRVSSRGMPELWNSSAECSRSYSLELGRCTDQRSERCTMGYPRRASVVDPLSPLSPRLTM